MAHLSEEALLALQVTNPTHRKKFLSSSQLLADRLKKLGRLGVNPHAGDAVYAPAAMLHYDDETGSLFRWHDCVENCSWHDLRFRSACVQANIGTKVVPTFL